MGKSKFTTFVGSRTNQNDLKKRLKATKTIFSEKQEKCRFVKSLDVFPAKLHLIDIWLDCPADALSTPSSFHCCLSQDSITCIILSPLLSSVLLEWCSSVLPPNLVKRELASSTPTLSLDFLSFTI